MSFVRKLLPKSANQNDASNDVKQKPVVAVGSTSAGNQQQQTLNDTKTQVAKPNQALSTPQAANTNANAAQKATTNATTLAGTNRKIMVNAGQKVIRLDNNLYLIRNPMPTAKGSGAIQKPAKNFIIAKCTCKQR